MLKQLITFIFLVLAAHTEAQVRYINCVLNKNYKKGFEYSKQYYFDSTGRIEKESINKPYKIYKILSLKSHITTYAYTYVQDSLMYVIHTYPCVENLETFSSKQLCTDTIRTCNNEQLNPYLFFIKRLGIPDTSVHAPSSDTIYTTNTESTCTKHMLVYNAAKQLILDSCMAYMPTDCHVGEFRCKRNTYTPEGRLKSSECIHIGAWGYYIELEYDPVTGFISRYRTDKNEDMWWYVFVSEQKGP